MQSTYANTFLGKIEDGKGGEVRSGLGRLFQHPKDLQEEGGKGS